MSELYLVRHAQASFGAANYDQLSDLGHQQSRWLGDHLGMRGMAVRSAGGGGYGAPP